MLFIIAAAFVASAPVMENQPAPTFTFNREAVSKILVNPNSDQGNENFVSSTSFNPNKSPPPKLEGDLTAAISNVFANPSSAQENIENNPITPSDSDYILNFDGTDFESFDSESARSAVTSTETKTTNISQAEQTPPPINVGITQGFNPSRPNPPPLEYDVESLKSLMSDLATGVRK